MRTDCAVAVQNVDTARQTVIVDVVLTNNTHRNAVVDLAGSHVNALWHQQVSGRKGDRIFVVDEVLWVGSSSRTQHGDSSAGSRQRSHSGQSLACRIQRWEDVQRSSRRAGSSGSHSELLERTSRFTGLWVDSVHASDSEHVADIPCLRRASKADWQCGLSFSCDGRSHSDGGAPIAVGVLLDRLRHVDFVEAQNACTHHAVLELAADGVGRIEQTFHAFNQTSVGSWVNGCVAWRHHSCVFVQLLLGLQQNERS